MRILAIVRQIPRGKVATYGSVARLAGLPRRARLVGRVLKTSPLAAGVPWYRVLNAAGKSSLQGDAQNEQRRRLQREGVHFDAHGRANLAQYLWLRAQKQA